MGDLFAYSNSRLVAVNQCPTWGVVSAQRKYPTEARSMALEAGSLMHEVYAGLRLWQLWHVQGLRKHAFVNGMRIFGRDRWAAIVKETGSKLARDNMMEMGFAVLDTAYWEDDPRDKNRTMESFKLCTIKYVDEKFPNLEAWPLYVAHEDDPLGVVGIEQTFDVTVTYTDGGQIRYIGTIDGLVWKLDGRKKRELFLDENKTAIRLDKGWREMFHMSNQTTGYCSASTVVFGFPVMKCRVTGSKIRPTGNEDDYYPFEVSRTADNIVEWARWLRHSTSMFIRYVGDYEHAPRYTHSCNRYFRPCSLLAFCADTPEGRRAQFVDQMVPVELSPSERNAID